MKGLLLWIAAVACADGQIRSLRVNEDGSRVYFVTDLRLRGSNQPLHGKAFTATAAGVETLLELPKPEPLAVHSAPFHVRSIDVSMDGSLIAYNLSTFCEQQLPCATVLKAEALVRHSDGRTLWRGTGAVLQLSPNGKYALVAQGSGVFRVTLSTGEKELLAPGVFDLSASIGDNGAVVLPPGFRLAYTSSATYRLLAAGDTRTWKLSGDGNHAAYYPVARRQMIVHDIRTDAETVVPGEVAGLSYDASRVLYWMLSPGSTRPEYYLLDRRSGETCYIYRDRTESRAELQLSGDGRWVYIANEVGIQRVGCGTPLIPVVWSPVNFAPQTQVVVPGSLLALYAGNILSSADQSAATPLPEDLGGFRMRLGDRLLPIEGIKNSVTRTRMEIRAQVPWDFHWPESDVPLGLETPQQSPFEARYAPGTVRVGSRQAHFLWMDDPVVEAYHAETMQPVTRTEPALPRERIHVILTGLGTVDKDVTTGMPAPGDPAARPVAPITCEGLQTEGALLVPGRVGAYQLTITMPDRWPVNAVQLRCGEAAGLLPFQN